MGKSLLSFFLVAVLTWSTIPGLSAVETVPIEGTTTPAVISVDVPMTISFSISGTQFTSVPTQIVNRGQAPVDIGLIRIAAVADNPTKVVNPNAIDWANAGSEGTTKNIALGLTVDGATYWSPPESTQLPVPQNEFMIKTLETKPVRLSARHGSSWPESRALDYQMTLSIRIHGSYMPCVRFVIDYPGTETKDVYMVLDKNLYGDSYRAKVKAEPLLSHRIDKMELEALPQKTVLEYPGGQMPLQIEFTQQITGDYFFDVTVPRWPGPTISDIPSGDLKPFVAGAYINNKTISPDTHGVQSENVYRIIAKDADKRMDELRVHVVLVQKR